MTTESRSFNGTNDAPEGTSVGAKAGETASEAKAAVQERVASGADASIDKAAEGLGAAAEKLRERAVEDDGIRSTLQTKAAEAMDKTAGYLNEHDSSELVKDLEEFVKAHPLQAAIGALAAGYLFGKLAR